MSLCRMCPFLNSPLEKDPLHAWHIYKLCSAELLTDASDSSIFSVDAVVSEKGGNSYGCWALFRYTEHCPGKLVRYLVQRQHAGGQ